MKTRTDGSRYPDSAIENAALEDFTDPASPTGLGSQRSLGDLIVTALVGRDLYQPDDCPIACETVEHAFLQQIGLELRALNVALCAGNNLTVDDGDCDVFTKDHAQTLLRNLAQRIEAGAELTVRLREARWSHPSFGGGEGWAAKKAVREEREAAE